MIVREKENFSKEAVNALLDLVNRKDEKYRCVQSIDERAKDRLEDLKKGKYIDM